MACGNTKGLPTTSPPRTGSETLMLGISRCSESWQVCLLFAFPCRGGLNTILLCMPGSRGPHSVAGENKALRGSQLSQSRNYCFLQNLHPFFLVLGGSRWGWSALPHVGASAVSDFTRKAARRKRPAALLPHPPPLTPMPQWAESLGLDILSGQM